MNDKKWYENIPEQGVLCKSIYGVILIKSHITEKYVDGYVVEYLIDDDGNQFNINEVTPLTPQEWWQFAPWQDVDENTPKNTPVLTIDNYGVIGIEQYLYWGYLKGTRKWLPLPEEK